MTGGKGGAFYTEGGKEWVEYQIHTRGSTYAEKYTEDIYRPNTFSSSILAYKVEKQINTKLGIIEPIPLSEKGRMAVGEAIHEWLQSRLSAGYTRDPEIRRVIPFEWKSLKGGLYDSLSHEIVIIGHPDAVNLFTANLLEYKTSFGEKADGVIHDWHVRQAAFYWDTINLQLKINCDVRVVKWWHNGVDGGISEWTLKPDEKIFYAKQMIDNAIEAATKLDKIYAEKGIPKLN